MRKAWIALLFACDKGLSGGAMALIGKEVDINLPNKAGQTPLMFAVVSNLTKVVQVLIERHVDTDVVFENDGVKMTALGLARKTGNKEIVAMLEKVNALELPAPNKDL